MNNYHDINEVARVFSITTNKIRYYEKKGLFEVLRDKQNGYRKFTDEDIMKLQAILLYRSMGLSIKAIKDIMSHNTSNNYLKHFNNQWQLVNNEIDRLRIIRTSLEKILDDIYASSDGKLNSDILYIIEKANKVNKIKNSWRDKWNFSSWADTYDEDVKKDKGDLKIYKNYELILETVYNLAINCRIENPYVLEIGVGTGNLAGKFVKDDYNIVGIDQSRDMLRLAKGKYPKLKVRIGEFLKIPYEDKCFDIIVSTYAFHHLNEEEKSIAIGEMLRVLKDSGKIIIGDLMFENRKEERKVLKDLSENQIDEIKDEYYSYIDVLEREFNKFNRKLKYRKIDEFNYIIEVH